MWRVRWTRVCGSCFGYSSCLMPNERCPPLGSVCAHQALTICNIIVWTRPQPCFQCPDRERKRVSILFSHTNPWPCASSYVCYGRSGALVCARRPVRHDLAGFVVVGPACWAALAVGKDIVCLSVMQPTWQVLGKSAIVVPPGLASLLSDTTFVHG